MALRTATLGVISLGTIQMGYLSPILVLNEKVRKTKCRGEKVWITVSSGAIAFPQKSRFGFPWPKVGVKAEEGCLTPIHHPIRTEYAGKVLFYDFSAAL